jgi:hypothetical protein
MASDTLAQRRPTMARAALLLLASLNACAASVAADRDGGAMDGARSDGATGDVGRDVRYRDVPDPLPDTFTDPPCPDGSTEGVRQYNCDPFSSSGCGPGEACYPYIEYPMGRCAAEIYHADCIPAGTVPVGSPCGRSGACEPGSSCFATGAGTRCLRLCRIDGTAPQCPRGAVCEPTDLPDFGACD